MKVLNIKQGHLTDECWLIQLHGLRACAKCPARDTSQCGGRGIFLSGKNKKGHKVPLGNTE